MTVAEYFAAHRDEHGRAWLTQHCWIEYGVGCFRLNTPGEEISLVGSDDFSVAASIAARAVVPPVDPAEEAGEPTREAVDEARDIEGDESQVAEEDVAINFGEDDIADQFDDFRGRGAWPGLSADDAESDDFEDSLGDMPEALDEDVDGE